MADGKELKPKSFRIDNATADKFKEISADIGGNQQETLSKLIEAWEFQAGKAILTDKKDDIDTFEGYVNALTRMYMTTLEDNQNITELVKAQFDAQLKSKDTTIQDLQEQIKVAKQLKQDSDDRVKNFSDLNSDLNKRLDKVQREATDKIDNLTSMLEDKEKLNQALNNNLADLQQKVDDMKAEHENYTALCSERDKLQAEVATLEKEKNAAEAKNESDKEKATLKQEKALLEQEKKYREDIEKIKIDCRTQIDEYQKKYLDLFDKLQNNDNKK